MDRFAIYLSLAALTASVFHAGVSGFVLVTGRWQRRAGSWSRLASALIGGTLLLAITMHWATGKSLAIPAAGLIVALLVAAGALALWSPRDPVKGAVRRRYAFAAWQVLLLAAAAVNFHAGTHEPGFNADLGGRERKVPIEHTVVVTDQGRVFPVFRYDVQGRDVLELAAYSSERKLVRMATPDARSNCHGWVFTSGRYAVGGEAVAALLQDNGYDPIGSPRRGDVIVYRDHSGKILHSGRVRSVHEDGQVWIESKWGASGRYLHLAEHQSYSNSFEYYRTSRESHAAQLVQTPMAGDTQMARGPSIPARRGRG